MNREQELRLIWRHTHRDFKGKLPDGTKTVLVLRAGGTTMVPLDQLTDDEIAAKMPHANHLEAKRLAKLKGE